MLFYPDKPLDPDETPPFTSVRGIVGQSTMLSITLQMIEEQVKAEWTHYESNSDHDLFGKHTSTLLALQDVGFEQNHNEEGQADSSTLRDSVEILRSRMIELESRLHCGHGQELFLFVPLEVSYMNIPHAIMEMGVRKSLPHFAEKNMKAHTNVQLHTQVWPALFGWISATRRRFGWSFSFPVGI